MAQFWNGIDTDDIAEQLDELAEEDAKAEKNVNAEKKQDVEPDTSSSQVKVTSPVDAIVETAKLGKSLFSMFSSQK